MGELSPPPAVDTTFFQPGGSLALESPSYIVRPADDRLFNAIRDRSYCYVLTPRQMGKSSLRVRTMARLTQENWRCAIVDITALGNSNSTADQWYFSFLYHVSGQFGLRRQFRAWWASHQELTVINRFIQYFSRFVPDHLEGKQVVFIDEIDSVLSLNRELINPNDFFAAIRALYNLRPDVPALNNLVFTIIGVATAGDLMQDQERTPFNIGVNIPLDYFDQASGVQLLKGFGDSEVDKEAVLKEALIWTGGQPVLTQALLRSLALDESISDAPKELVRKHVDQLYLNAGRASVDPHLGHMELRITGNANHAEAMLQTYRDVLLNGSVDFEAGSHPQAYLKLSGLVRETSGKLEVVNQLYQEIFNLEWVDRHLSQFERPFQADMERWQELGRPESAALRGEVLDEAIKWSLSRRDITELENEFLDFSMGAKQRYLKRQRKRRYRMAGLIMVLFLSVGAVTLYWYVDGVERKLAKTHKEASEYESKLDIARDSLKVSEQDLELLKIKYKKKRLLGDSAEANRLSLEIRSKEIELSARSEDVATLSKKAEELNQEIERLTRKKNVLGKQNKEDVWSLLDQTEEYLSNERRTRKDLENGLDELQRFLISNARIPIDKRRESLKVFDCQIATGVFGIKPGVNFSFDKTTQITNERFVLIKSDLKAGLKLMSNYYSGERAELAGKIEGLSKQLDHLEDAMVRSNRQRMLTAQKKIQSAWPDLNRKIGKDIPQIAYAQPLIEKSLRRMMRALNWLNEAPLYD